MPITSTPKVVRHTRSLTKKMDVDTAFGFDESWNSEGGGANHSAFMSPIAHASPTKGVPVWKVNPLTQRNAEMPSFPSQPIKLTTRTESDSKQVPPKPKPVTSAADRKPRATKRTKTRPTTAVVTSSPPRRSTRRRKPIILPDDFQGEPTATVTESPLFKDADTDGGAKVSFTNLLEKYQDDKGEPKKDEEEDEVELFVDPKKIIRTYTSKRKRSKYSEDRESECDFLPSSGLEFQILTDTKKKQDGKKRGKRAASKFKNQQADIDEEAEKKWLEEKNREFEDVLKAPLVIENSFSD